jgi:ribosome biogenesis GTPase
VVGVQRSGLTVLCSLGLLAVTVPPALFAGTEPAPTVGDWVLVDAGAARVNRLVPRHSLLARMAAGTRQRIQAIAANLDTLFVVTSCNADFNASRLERYLALAFEAGITPVIVLTKADLCARPESYLEIAASLAPGIAAVAVDATTAASTPRLAPWLGCGRTVALAGSSGVGKSTLINRLVGKTFQDTAGIREDDAHGRHTTTSRGMFALPTGGWVIDTPGMRELRVGAVDAGLGSVFDEVERLAGRCRFGDCNHAGDAGCAVERAVADGQLDARRLASYRKLQREAAGASQTLRERHERERRFGILQRQAQRTKRDARDR